MTQKTMAEILDELRKVAEQQMQISTTSTVYKGRIKQVLSDCIEFEDRGKVQSNIIYIPFTAIESFSLLP